MVTCNLKGGLGNQMFQIAATIGLAKKNGVGYRIPLTTQDCDPRSMLPFVGRFMHFPPLTVKSDFVNVYKEPRFVYDDIPFFDWTLLDGYFQSEKYFEHCKKDIYDAFSEFRTSLHIDYCSIHVRRGDYLNLPDIHTNLQLDYYFRAVNLIKEKTIIKKFMVFSDDIDWCRKNFIGDEFHFSEGLSEMEDMNLMTRCKHHIIANSSFSWWGSYLCSHEMKKIIAPKKWFGVNSNIPDWSSIYTNNMIVI